VKFLKEEMERLKVERKQMKKGPQITENRGGFRRPNNFAPPATYKEKERDRDDQRIQAPFQNNFVAEEREGETDKPEPNIHSVEVTPPFPHLTQSAYEESLMNSQLNELSKGDKASGGRGRYNLRSDKRAATPDVPSRPLEQRSLLMRWQTVTEVRRSNPSLPLSKVMYPKLEKFQRLHLPLISSMRSKRSESLCPSLSLSNMMNSKGVSLTF
jgi:hypothetical protein